MTANLKDREVKKDTMKLKKRRRVETILSGIHTEGMIQDIRGMVREETIPDIIERMIEEIIEAQEEKDEIIEETAIIIKIEITGGSDNRGDLINIEILLILNEASKPRTQ